MVAAALLRILRIPAAVIIAEYLLSDEEVNRAWIQQALMGLREPTQYFQRVNLALVVRAFQGKPLRTDNSDA